MNKKTDKCSKKKINYSFRRITKMGQFCCKTKNNEYVDYSYLIHNYNRNNNNNDNNRNNNNDNNKNDNTLLENRYILL